MENGRKINRRTGKAEWDVRHVFRCGHRSKCIVYRGRGNPVHFRRMLIRIGLFIRRALFLFEFFELFGQVAFSVAMKHWPGFVDTFCIADFLLIDKVPQFPRKTRNVFRQKTGDTEDQDQDPHKCLSIKSKKGTDPKKCAF